jgi:hypothetical protein
VPPRNLPIHEMSGIITVLDDVIVLHRNNDVLLKFFWREPEYVRSGEATIQRLNLIDEVVVFDHKETGWGHWRWRWWWCPYTDWTSLSNDWT